MLSTISRWSMAVMVLLLLLHADLKAQTPAASDKDFDPDRYLSELGRTEKFFGVVLVQSEGKTLFNKAYGPAVLGWKIPNGLNTRFEIASLTKQFTGAAILQLAEAGKIGLGDPVAKYYGAAPATWRDVTVEQLVSHTSGLPNNKISDFTKGITVPYTLDELIATFRDRPLVSKPGASWAYTNTEYYLLAYLIEHVSGESYGKYLAHHVFEPAGMRHTGFAGTLDIVDEAAEGYVHDAGVLRHRDYFDRSLEVGAGGIYSTADDLVLGNQVLDAEKLINRASLDKMFAPSVPGGYGFGWFITKDPYLRQFHEGSDPGFTAFEARYPTKNTVIIVLSNLDDAPVREIEGKLASHFINH